MPTTRPRTPEWSATTLCEIQRAGRRLTCALLLACGSDDEGPEPTSAAHESSTGTEADDTGTPGESSSDAGGSSSGAAESGELPDVACLDTMILDLGLVEGKTSEGAVTSTAEGDDWISNVDATAGGLPNAPMNPWVYLQFTADGLERVDIDDFQALESTAWHIAAKRFGIRLNSGTGGPASVTAAAVEGRTFAEVTEVPADLAFAEEAYYDDACTLFLDGQGSGGPAFLLSPWWSYPNCVATTGTPFVLALGDDTHVKLVVEAYYGEGQDTCNETGTMGTNAAQFRFRWAYLP